MDIQTVPTAACIPLNKGFHAIVDDCDMDWLSEWRWLSLEGDNGHVCAARSHYFKVPGRPRKAQKTIYMHRAILGIIDPDVYVDHRNGNPLDNRRDNLRVASSMENSYNRQPNRNTRTGFKGVNFSDGRWMARISVLRNRLFIGRFNTPEEAARAYDAKAKELHGEFARLNFPDRH